MSFRSKERVVRIPSTRRSSSTSRAPSSSNSNYMSHSSRPHNLNLYSTPTTSLSASSSFNTHHPRSISTSYSSLPQSPSYKTSSGSSGYGSYGLQSSNYGLGSYGSYGTGLHGSLTSLNSLNHLSSGYGNASKRNSYKRNGGYSKNGYSTFTLAFESPKHYQPKPTSSSQGNSGTQPVPPQRVSRSRSRQDRNNSEGGKRSHSLNSLAGSEGYASGSERSSRSRLGSSTSLVDGDNDVTENGSDVIDYKALWESAKADNERLQEQLKKRNEELRDAKATIDRVTSATNKGTLSELEKREKRAMERKLSEMEEELKHLELLKTENQRLKDENGALIRVISKLSK